MRALPLTLLTLCSAASVFAAPAPSGPPYPAPAPSATRSQGPSATGPVPTGAALRPPARPSHRRAPATHLPGTGDARSRVADANLAARVEPSRAGYVGAIQVYPFSDGALYQVYAAPGEVTDLALEPGEALVGTGPVAAGDTVRWIIGDTESGSGALKRVHILVKPTAADLNTNLVVNTDRRTYHLELRSGERTYMASVSFAYPSTALIAIAGRPSPDKPKAEAAPPPPSSSGLDIDALNFRYRITGDKPPWRPLRAFDDGRQTFIQFPPNVARGEMPPLWVSGPSGTELVNYRVQGAHMVVDRLFAAAELRLGGKHQLKVRIVRDDKAARS